MRLVERAARARMERNVFIVVNGFEFGFETEGIVDDAGMIVPQEVVRGWRRGW